jgi:quercetin dioxygenase-like cupin family protein
MDALQPERAERIDLGATSVRVLMTADLTDGAMTVMEIIMPAGTASAPHTHLRDDETFLIVAGTFTFRADGRVERVPAGGRLFLPRGSRHAFANEGDTEARAITVLMPGGLEDFLRAATGPDRPRDTAAARELERRHGLDFTPDP